jgi:hypothetical protein
VVFQQIAADMRERSSSSVRWRAVSPARTVILHILSENAELRADADLEGARVGLHFQPHCYQIWKIQREQ